MDSVPTPTWHSVHLQEVPSCHGKVDPFRKVRGVNVREGDMGCLMTAAHVVAPLVDPGVQAQAVGILTPGEKQFSLARYSTLHAQLEKYQKFISSYIATAQYSAHTTGEIPEIHFNLSVLVLTS